MRLLRRESSIPLGLSILAVVASVLQRPGLRVAETKVDLHVSPGSFLHDVVSAWTPQTSLGHVFAGQYGGYLWPMGPWFAARRRARAARRGSSTACGSRCCCR